MTIESLLTRRITRREKEDVFIFVVIQTILLLRKVPGSGRYPGMASFLRQRRRRRRQRRTPGRRESSDAVAVLPRYVSVFLSVVDDLLGLVRFARPRMTTGIRTAGDLGSLNRIAAGRNARRGKGSFSQGWLEGYNYRWSRVVD